MKTYKKSFVRKKKYFMILTEILIAITLLGLCLSPLIHSPSLLFKKTISKCIKLEALRLSPLFYAEVRALCSPKKTLSLATNKTEAPWIPLEKKQLHIEALRTYEIHPFYKIYTKRNVKKANDHTYTLVECELKLLCNMFPKKWDQKKKQWREEPLVLHESWIIEKDEKQKI